MKILVYENRKADSIYWNASTSEKRDAALLCLFRHLDEDWECYEDLDGKQMALRDRARNGEIAAVKALLTLRKGVEYEEWRWDEVLEPSDEPNPWAD